MILRTHCTERPQVEVRVAELQRIERPPHRRTPVGQAPLALAMLQGHTEPGASVLGVDREVVRVEHVGLVGGEAVHRADQAVAVEGADGHAALADGRDQHVDRNEFSIATPDARLQSRHGGELDRPFAVRGTRCSPPQNLHRLGHRVEERPDRG